MKHEVFFLTSIFLCIYRWFSQWRHQILKSKSLGLLNFCVYYVEDDLEINIFRSYQFHNVFRFENTAFWIYELSPCVTPRYKPVWFKKHISLYDSPSLNVSSISGDVFVHICTVSRVKSKRFHRKVNSRCFVDFRPPYWWTKVVHQHGDSIQNSIMVNDAYEINHMWTADMKSNEEWSSQLWSQFFQLRKEKKNFSGFFTQLQKLWS